MHVAALLHNAFPLLHNLQTCTYAGYDVFHFLFAALAYPLITAVSSISLLALFRISSEALDCSPGAAYNAKAAPLPAAHAPSNPSQESSVWLMPSSQRVLELDANTAASTGSACILMPQPDKRPSPSTAHGCTSSAKALTPYTSSSCSLQHPSTRTTASSDAAAQGSGTAYSNPHAAAGEPDGTNVLGCGCSALDSGSDLPVAPYKGCSIGSTAAENTTLKARGHVNHLLPARPCFWGIRKASSTVVAVRSTVHL
jgi:hypothetical protein